MSQQIVAVDPQELPAVAEAIHDHWFDLDQTVFDAASTTLSFTFARPPAGVADRHILTSRRREAGYVESFLRIRRVVRWRIEDTNRVRYYDFNEIEYNPDKRVVRLTTGIPILIEVEVQGLEIVVEITDKVVAD